jgi:ribosome biogenesis GTPase
LQDYRFDIDAARPALNRLGWKPEFEIAYREYEAEGLVPARVLSRHRDRWSLAFSPSREGEKAYHEADGILPGSLRANPDRAGAEQPTVGDWVLAEPGEPHLIRRVLPRRSAFLRRRAGKPVEAQALAANADYAAIVMGLDELQPAQA